MSKVLKSQDVYDKECEDEAPRVSKIDEGFTMMKDLMGEKLNADKVFTDLNRTPSEIHASLGTAMDGVATRIDGVKNTVTTRTRQALESLVGVGMIYTTTNYFMRSHHSRRKLEHSSR